MPTITGGITVYKNDYCVEWIEDSHMTQDLCSQTTTIYSLDVPALKELGAGIIFYGFAMVSVIMIILRVIRKILHFK